MLLCLTLGMLTHIFSSMPRAKIFHNRLVHTAPAAGEAVCVCVDRLYDMPAMELFHGFYIFGSMRIVIFISNGEMRISYE